MSAAVLVQDKLADEFMAKVVPLLEDLSLKITWRVTWDLLIHIESRQLSRSLDFHASMHEVYFSPNSFPDRVAQMIRNGVSRYRSGQNGG